MTSYNKKFSTTPVPGSIKEKFSNSNLVLNFLLKGNDVPLTRARYHENPYGMYWIQINKIMQGISDWRARSGTFNTPWNAPSNKFYKIPKMEFIDDKLEHIYDERATQLYNEAKNKNKKLAVMWSGGIDSTSVLVSLLKNIPVKDHELIEVICNTDSIFEHPQFFLKHIAGKITTRSSVFFKMTNNFLNKYILLHGDPADCLFGPSISRMKEAIKNKLHHNSWKDNMDLIQQPLIRILQDRNSFSTVPLPDEYKKDNHMQEFSKNCVKWFCDKVSNNIIENKQDNYLTSITDWYWWTYMNFKWEFSCQRPFLYNNSEDFISFEKQHEFANNTFFNTDKFQRWSYTHLKELIPLEDMSKHKHLVKKYIFEYSKINEYYKYKNKIAGIQPALKIKKLNSLYDLNWQPVYSIGSYYDKQLSEYRG